MVARPAVAPRRPLLVAAVVMALGSMLSIADPAAGAQQQVSVGIFDDDGGQAMFPGLTLAPGRQYAQCLLVGAEAATVQDTVQFGVAGVSGELAQHLLLSVEAGTGARFGDCSTFSGSSIFSGSLADLSTAGQGYGVPTGWRPALSASTAFRVTVSLAPALAQQGLQAHGRFVWRLVSTGVAPSTPTPGSGAQPGPSLESGSGAGGPNPDGAQSASPTPSPTEIAVVEPTPPSPAGARPARSEPDITIGQRLARLAELVDQAWRAMVAMVVEPQYPVAAILIALFFLLVQDRIDRRDPKLAAVARQRDNAADFPDRFGVGSGL